MAIFDRPWLDYRTAHSVELKETERLEIERQTLAFQRKGGTVVEVSPYANAENKSAFRPMTQLEEMAVKTRCGLRANAKMTLIYRPQERLWHATLSNWSLGLFPSQLSAEDAIRAKAKEVFSESKAKPKARYSDKEIGELLVRVERNV